MRCGFELYPTPSEKLYRDMNSKELTEVCLQLSDVKTGEKMGF